MNRRNFLKGMLAAAAAPAIVKAENIMRVKPPEIIRQPILLVPTRKPNVFTEIDPDHPLTNKLEYAYVHMSQDGKVIARWDRSLSEDDIKHLTIDPYCFLRPA